MADTVTYHYDSPLLLQHQHNEPNMTLHEIVIVLSHIGQLCLMTNLCTVETAMYNGYTYVYTYVYVYI